MTHAVSLYLREHSTRKYVRADPKIQYPLGTIFVLRYTHPNGKRAWKTLPASLSYKEALLKAHLLQIALIAGYDNEGVPLPALTPVKPRVVQPDVPMLDAAIDRYLANTATRSDKTVSGYTHTLRQFYRSSGNASLADLTDQHLLDFASDMRKQGLGDRTIYNRLGELKTFLRTVKKVCPLGLAIHNKEVNIKVKFAEKKVRAYRPDELRTLFAAATPDEWLLYQFFLCSGAREQEVMNARFSDVDFHEGIFTIREKDDWRTKDREEREIPLPDFLLLALKARAGSGLMFPTAAGKRDGHMLRKLQTLAKRAGLNPADFGLHVFRKSYSTLQHRAGVDARTLQKRLGHSSLETTLAYLEGEEARSERSREQANSTFGVFANQKSQWVGREN